MKPKQKTFREYLLEKGHTPKTIKSYTYVIDHYLRVCRGAEKYKYRDVLGYMGTKAKEYKNSGMVNAILSAIKKYYDYLIEIGRREDHPCRTLFLKSRRGRDVIHQDLFSSAELSKLLEREERYADLRLKNQTLVSLLIYQGLTAGEIADMKVQHVDLDKGTIFVKDSRKLAKRHLDIHPKQYRILDSYIHDWRKELMSVETDALIVGKLGTPITTEDLHYIVSTFKGLFPDRNLNPKTIRQSVIANWLNEQRLPIEQVQLMAGHRWISSTDKYRFTPIEEQREIINKFHPLR